MDKKKQIKSTDWLTKNYSKEELAEIKAKADKEAEEELKQKQIEEMACEMCGNKDFCPVNPNVCISYTCNLYNAKMLLDKGYRKETQGEWIDLYKGKYENKLYACSVCGKGAFLRVEADELNTPRTVQALTPYCPHCGARMKGAD